MYEVELLRDGRSLAVARGRTLETAILNARRRAGVAQGYPEIALLERFGETVYRVQFGRWIERANATALSSTYVVHVMREGGR